jgi:CxxC-x17-CxxC domain-containing protein
MIDGVACRPFSATTLGPIKVEELSFKDKIIESSRKIYGSLKIDIEKHIREWQESLDKEGVEKIEKQKIDTRPRFEGVCVVCGTKVQVPFEPDPSRPLFCKDHLEMTGQYKSTPKPNNNFVSLKNLKRPPLIAPRTDTKNDLSALREALKKSLSSNPPTARVGEAQTGAKTLKPGDKIEI